MASRISGFGDIHQGGRWQVPAPNLGLNFSLFGSIAYFGHWGGTQGFAAAPSLTGISGRNPGIKGQTSTAARLFSPCRLP
jgi:hypothetical protein